MQELYTAEDVRRITRAVLDEIDIATNLDNDDFEYDFFDMEKAVKDKIAEVRKRMEGEL